MLRTSLVGLGIILTVALVRFGVILAVPLISLRIVLAVPLVRFGIIRGDATAVGLRIVLGVASDSYIADC